jgi:DNA-binding transcriptional regulator YiaG
LPHADFNRNGVLARYLSKHHALLLQMSVATLIELAQIRAMTRSGKAREIRGAAQLSQAEVAAALGVHTSTVNRWESGECTPMGEAGLRYGELLEALRKAIAE